MRRREQKIKTTYYYKKQLEIEKRKNEIKRQEVKVKIANIKDYPTFITLYNLSYAISAA